MTLYALTLADCTKINDVVPPTVGQNVGRGPHVVVPPDWQARITAGVHVPGCTYALPDEGGNVHVDAVLLAKLNASGKASAVAISAKIALATPVVVEELIE